MEETSKAVGDYYAKEICTLLPLHRMCIFLISVIYSNYILNEIPFVKWGGEENIVPDSQSFWIYLSGQSLNTYLSLDDGIFLHGKISIYMLALVLIFAIFLLSRVANDFVFDLFKKLFPVHELCERQKDIAKGESCHEIKNGTIYLSHLSRQKGTLQVKLRHYFFYSELVVGFFVISTLSMFSTEGHRFVDLSLCIFAFIVTIFINYMSVRLYITKYIPLALSIQNAEGVKFQLGDDYHS